MYIGIGITLSNPGKAGDPVPAIRLSARTIAEDASINDVIGTLSVANGSGTYTFSITADPDSKFNISGANLRVGAALDYETKASHSVTIQADNGVDDPISRTFTITVTNVVVIPSTIADLTAEALDHESVELSYTPASNADSYEYRFREVGDTEWSEAAELVADTVSGLSPDTSYQFQVRGVSADPEAEDAAWSNTATATTEVEPDVSGPTVLSFSPADNATSVSVSATSLIITFSEPIQIGATASLRLYKADGDLLVQEWTEADALILVAEGDQLEMMLDNPLEGGVDYYVQIDSGSVEDLANNAYAGISNETTWNFTTAATAPSAFVSGNWSIASGDEEADVTINTLPAANGATITDIEYRLDGGSWVSSGGTTSFAITGLTNDQEYDVELRAVNSVGAGPASDTKQVTPSGAAYVGPGDIVSGALAWWGLRAYSEAEIGSDALHLTRASDSTTEQFVTLANGSLDVASIATFLASTSVSGMNVRDQSGNTRHVSGVNFPAYTPSAIGSLPGLTFDGVNDKLATDDNYAGSAQPFTVSAVYKRASTFTSDTSVAGQVAAPWTAGSTTSNTARAYGGSSLTASCSDDAFHAVQLVFNGSSSHLYIDGSDTSGNAGTQALTNAKFLFGSDGYDNHFKGVICEVGIWPIAFDSGQLAAINANQRAYWGF